MGRSSETAHENRIADIVKKMIHGVTDRKSLLQYITKNYPIKESQADKDMKAAREVIRQMRHEDLDEEISDAIARYKYLIKQNLQEADYREARSCQSDLNKLLGLDAPKRVEVKVKAGLDAEDQYE